jgi:hypothetical protein
MALRGCLPGRPRGHPEAPSFARTPGHVSDEPGQFLLGEQRLAGFCRLHAPLIPWLSRGGLDKHDTIAAEGGLGGSQPSGSRSDALLGVRS